MQSKPKVGEVAVAPVNSTVWPLFGSNVNEKYADILISRDCLKVTTRKKAAPLRIEPEKVPVMR